MAANGRAERLALPVARGMFGGMKLTALFVRVVLPLIPLSVSAADEWRVWRGDSAMTGVSAVTFKFPLKLAWKFAAARPVKATAVSDGSFYYIGDGKGVFRSLKAADGTVAWEFAAKDAIEGSALLAGELVIFGSLDGSVYALEAATGKERWRFATEGEVRSGPNVWMREGGKPLVIVGSYDNKLYALDGATGAKVWTVETGNYVNGSASLTDGQLMFGGCDGYLYFVKLEDGSETGKTEVNNPISSTVAARNGVAVFGHYGNEVVAVDARTRMPKWTYKDREFPFFSSPAITAEGMVYAGDRGKRLHCLSLADGEEKWAFRAKGRVDSSPVVAGDAVVFGSDDGFIYAVGAKDGEELWKYEAGQPVQTSACPAAGGLVMGADDGVIYCFRGAE